MKELKPTKTCLYKELCKQINLLLLLNICILFLSACTCNNPQPVQGQDPLEESSKPDPKKDPPKEDKHPDEAVIFIGNPGVGKSTLCNSIFEQAVFQSGVSFGTGLTPQWQEHMKNWIIAIAMDY
jgi:hypothetical protein